MPIPDCWRIPFALGIYTSKAFERAYEQNSKAFKKWLDEVYPKIATKAKKRMLRFTDVMKQVFAMADSKAAAHLFKS